MAVSSGSFAGRAGDVDFAFLEGWTLYAVLWSVESSSSVSFVRRPYLSSVEYGVRSAFGESSSSDENPVLAVFAPVLCVPNRPTVSEEVTDR